jgi:formylglycine-generating enzyme required for sulfatase activity
MERHQPNKMKASFVKIKGISIALTICAVTLLSANSVRRARVNPKDGLAYVWIPSGTYWTGCLQGDAQCIGWERTRAEIRIEEGFWIGQTEVTQAAYKESDGRRTQLLPWRKFAGGARRMVGCDGIL